LLCPGSYLKQVTRARGWGREPCGHNAQS
jgi:hypothetical protein